MYKFFVNNNQISNNQIIITKNDKNHIANVLRMKVKEKILVTSKDTFNTYECEIANINKKEVICKIIKKDDSVKESSIIIDLYQGIPKSDKMEYIIQKTVELGVNTIFPVNMKNCIAKIKDEDKKQTRWQKISEAAAKQCKRNIIPAIEKSVNMNFVFDNIKNYDLAIVAYENEDNKTIKDILHNNNNNIKKIAIIVGPEGGFTEEEISELISNGASIVSLGNRILRTETAPIAILSMIMYEYDL